MGIAVTVVCTVSAYTYTIAEYLPNSNAALGYTGIVNGASCAFQFTNAISGDVEEVFNTTSGHPIKEPIQCTVPPGGSVCTTGYITFNGAPFAAETFEIEQFFNGVSDGVLNGTANWTYIALPPVPQQTPQPVLINNNLSLLLTTSPNSQVFGYPLIGCVVSAGKSPYNGNLAPLTLSSNQAQNNIPTGAAAIYANPPLINESSALVFTLTSLNIPPNAQYDIHWICYNSQGRSPDTLLFNITTPGNEPLPSNNNGGGVTNSGGSSDSTSLSKGGVAGVVIGCVVGSLLLCFLFLYICGFRFVGNNRSGKKSTEYDGGAGPHSQLESSRHQGDVQMGETNQ